MVINKYYPKYVVRTTVVSEHVYQSNTKNGE